MARKILVVDDTRNVQVLLNDFLLSQDFEVLTAYDGREAMEVVRESNPDLILLDIMMPNMDGLPVHQPSAARIEHSRDHDHRQAAGSGPHPRL